MKKELTEAREQIQENLITYLDGIPNDIKTQVCQIIVDGFAPLFAELRERTRRSVTLSQIGQTAYRVETTTNFLDLRVGILISREEAEKLRVDGIQIRVQRNK